MTQIFKPLSIPASEPTQAEPKLYKPLPNPRGPVSPEEAERTRAIGAAMIAEARNRPPLSSDERARRRREAAQFERGNAQTFRRHNI